MDVKEKYLGRRRRPKIFSLFFCAKSRFQWEFDNKGSSKIEVNLWAHFFFVAGQTKIAQTLVPFLL